MAKKYLSLDRLTEYDALLKSVIDEKIDIAKNDLLNGAGEAYDTLKELGDLIDENTTALEALESVASGKADASHNHDDVYYTEAEIDEQIAILQEQLDNSAGKDVSGQTFTIVTGQDENGNDISEDVVAGTGAEVFNDYNNNKASGKYSHAEGSWTTSSGSFSHAEGYDTKAEGQDAHAEGYSTTASGSFSHAEGENVTASGQASHAEGCYSNASGTYSHAEGYSSIASGNNSHAEGAGTTASKYGSHSEGSNTTASGYASHAEGDSAVAEGDYSHAEGKSTSAKGELSHAEGEGTIASGYCQHVQGGYNIEDTDGKYVHIVGNGFFDSPSNAHTLDWEGNAWFAGDVYVGSASGTNKDEGSVKLLKEGDAASVIIREW